MILVVLQEGVVLECHLNRHHVVDPHVLIAGQEDVQIGIHQDQDQLIEKIVTITIILLVVEEGVEEEEVVVVKVQPQQDVVALILIPTAEIVVAVEVEVEVEVDQLMVSERKKAPH